MKFLNKTRALTASLDSLINARAFLEKLIDIKTNAQLYKDYEQNLAQASNKICGDITNVFGHTNKEPWFDSKQPIDTDTAEDTIRCIKSGNHSGNHKGYNPFRLGGKFLEWTNKEDKNETPKL